MVSEFPNTRKAMRRSVREHFTTNSTIEVLQSKFMSKESNTVAYFHQMKPIATITHLCSMDQVSVLGAYDSLVCFELKVVWLVGWLFWV